MCGIVAIYSYKSEAPPVDGEELYRIRETMVSRGPDGKGIWVSDNCKIGMAHRRLSIIDLTDAGSQPMSSVDENCRIVFNGEIYNYQDLRAGLKKQGYQFRSTSDTEVLLNLYLKKGFDMVQDLRGMYAFAIWDEKRRGLFLARDPFGIKPLYFADDGKVIRVASQVKALISGGHIDTAPQSAGHVGFFLWGYVPEPYTLYRGIRALPAGSTLWIDEHGVHKAKSFFNLSMEMRMVNDSVKNHKHLGSQEIKDRLRSALVDSIKHHMVADVPVGVFLSSGLDSTTLTALTSEQVSDSIHTVSLGFKEYRGTVNDETPLAELLSRQYNTFHQTKWVSRKDFDDDIDSLFQAMDQPSIDGVNTYFVSKVTADTGLKVAISGVGGDEIFAGYPSFTQVQRLVNSLGIIPHISSLGKGFRWILTPILQRFTSPKYASLLEYGGSYGGAYLLRRGLFMPWELPEFLDGELVKKGWQELDPLARLEESVNGINHARLKVSALEMTWYMRNQLLRDTDWAGMAHSLEIRVPLVDLQFLRSIAPLFACKTPPSKQDMASAPVRPLPDKVLSRPKTGFSVPVRKWLLEDGRRTFAGRGLRGWAHKVFTRFCSDQ
jgi:asparagine synthase (glutamine-hydrolysing)